VYSVLGAGRRIHYYCHRLPFVGPAVQVLTILNSVVQVKDNHATSFQQLLITHWPHSLLWPYPESWARAIVKLISHLHVFSQAVPFLQVFRTIFDVCLPPFPCTLYVLFKPCLSNVLFLLSTAVTFSCMTHTNLLDHSFSSVLSIFQFHMTLKVTKPEMLLCDLRGTPRSSHV
jgi:hypothetical protein